MDKRKLDGPVDKSSAEKHTYSICKYDMIAHIM